MGMDKHLFCLKKEICDFKNPSCKLFPVFVDFRYAFGTQALNVINRTLDEIQLAYLSSDIVEKEHVSSSQELTTALHLITFKEAKHTLTDLHQHEQH